MVWRNWRMKLLRRYRKCAAWLILALRRIRGWKHCSSPLKWVLGRAERGVLVTWDENRTGMTTYLKVADITGTLEGHLQNHLNLLALFVCVSRYGTNENCLPLSTWIFKTFSTGPKEEGRQSGTVLMRTSCHVRGKQAKGLKKINI